MASDDRLFHRVALTTGVVAAVAFLALAAYFPWAVSLSFALGVGLGLASLGTLSWLVYRVTAGEAEGARKRLFAAGLLHVGKYALIGLAFYLLFRMAWVHPLALVAGITLPTAVLCLKGAGRVLNDRLGVVKGPSPDRDPGDSRNARK
jgi:hypothetical protein